MINIFRLAYRNVLAHKTKTLIIGILVTLSVFVFVLVNSFLSSVEQGMEKTYRHSLTGDLAIFKNITFDYSMFGTWGDMGNIVMPSIPDYSKVREQVEAHPQVESVLSLSSGFAVLLNNGEVTNEWTVLFGIDPQEYAQMFDLEDTITLVQGRFLQKGEKGVVLPQYLVDKYLSTEGIALEVGQDIYLMSWGGGGNPRIRTLPLVGIYQYNHITLGKAMEDSLPMLSRTAFLDIESYRAIAEQFTAASTLDIPEDEGLAFLDAGDFDNLFSNTLQESSLTSSSDSFLDPQWLFGTEEEAETPASIESAPAKGVGNWHWLLIRLKDSAQGNLDEVRKEINEIFKKDMRNFNPQDFPNPQALANVLSGGRNQLAKVLWPLVSEEDQENLLMMDFMEEKEAQELLAQVFNSFLQQGDLWVPEIRVRDYYFSRVTRDLINSRPGGEEQRRLARLIMEENFPDYILPGPDVAINYWWQAGAPMSFMTMGIGALFNFGMIIIFVVIAIVMANTMMISIMERTGEIGTIRALGGEKGFVTNLFLAESTLLLNAFALLGIGLALVLLFFLGTDGIPLAEDNFLVSMLGSRVYYPAINFWVFIQAFVLMNLVGFFASVFPIDFALKVSPLKAMQEES